MATPTTSGDSWEHELVVRDVRRLGRHESAYGVLGGSGACPPEDVGGGAGYADFLAALADADHAERDDLLDWVGGRWDADEFDVSAADARMQSTLPG